MRLHRPLRGQPSRASIIRSGKRWRVSITCELGPAPEKRTVTSGVGIDAGLENFLTLSDGQAVDNPRWLKQSEEELDRVQRQLSNKKRGSRNRPKARQAVVRCHERIASRRRNFCHHVSKWLVSKYDLIGFEKLKIQGMARTYCAKSILDAAWGIVLGQIVYKAEEAGKWAVGVDPRGTTQLRSSSGATVPKTLAEREHRCRCGLLRGRDHNAALNILALGRSAAGLRPQESYKSS